jgi:glycogen operon protein
MVLNAHHDQVTFTLPVHPGGSRWSLLIDTNAPGHEAADSVPFGELHDVTARSLLLFVLVAAP